jgi:hypothetical protein
MWGRCRCLGFQRIEHNWLVVMVVGARLQAADNKKKYLELRLGTLWCLSRSRLVVAAFHASVVL